MGLFEEILSMGFGGGIIIDVGTSRDPSSYPAANLPLHQLGYEAEFERVRAEVSKREVDIHLARADECMALKALRTKQGQWGADHPDDELNEENAPYVAFADAEHGAAVAAIEKTDGLRDELREFIIVETERLHQQFHETHDRAHANAEQEPAPAGS